jgi:hypothetical protein
MEVLVAFRQPERSKSCPIQFKDRSMFSETKSPKDKETGTTDIPECSEASEI